MLLPAPGRQISARRVRAAGRWREWIFRFGFGGEKPPFSGQPADFMCRRMRSEIMAMNSLLVGFPLVLWMV